MRLRPLRHLLLALTLPLLALSLPADGDLLLVMGAPGEEDYLAPFQRTTAAWIDASDLAGLNTHTIGAAIAAKTEESAPPLRDELRDWLAAQPKEGTTPLWFVYVGHGTFDGRIAKLNLRGPDVSAAELREWFQPFTRPMVIVHGGSASAPFVNALSATNRIVISATENANEINYARFGERFANAVADPKADIDRDGQTSVLEAFISAANKTELYYDENGRLSTEHALIDDNGDGRGTPFDWFNGTRLVKRAKQPTHSPDGKRAKLISLIPSLAEQNLTDDQRETRDNLEAKIEQLRLQKETIEIDDYYTKLETLFRQLSQIYLPKNSE